MAQRRKRIRNPCRLGIDRYTITLSSLNDFNISQCPGLTLVAHFSFFESTAVSHISPALDPQFQMVNQSKNEFEAVLFPQSFVIIKSGRRENGVSRKGGYKLLLLLLLCDGEITMQIRTAIAGEKKKEVMAKRRKEK